MKHPRLIAFCVFWMLMLFVADSSFAFSQELEDVVFKEFFQGYYDEFHNTEEQRQILNEYLQLTFQFRDEMMQSFHENITKRAEERMNALGPNPTPEEINTIQLEVFFENEYTLHQKLAEKEKEMFPDVMERQKRKFQLREGMTDRLETFGNPQDIHSLIYSRSSVENSLYPPDFLELTPEQRDLIKKIQKETDLKIRRVDIKSWSEQPDKVKEYEQWHEKLISGQADEGPNEIIRKSMEIRVDMLKNYIPELKAILIEGRESYMRVLTDAQKAKIKAVMDDMPDYMKNLFAAIDKQGGGLSILHNWQPGMGVPDYPNPNREAPRERPQGERSFPQ